MFGKKRLKLWSADGCGNYADGSWLIAAETEEQFKEIWKEATSYWKDWNWTFQQEPGEIIGIEPGVVHWHYYTE
jgi:hypothetical protein